MKMIKRFVVFKLHEYDLHQAALIIKHRFLILINFFIIQYRIHLVINVFGQLINLILKPFTVAILNNVLRF